MLVDGQPAAGLPVRLVGLIDGRLAVATGTAADGTFGLPWLAADIYALDVGQRTVQLVVVGEGEQLILDPISLESGTFEGTPIGRWGRVAPLDDPLP